MKQEIKSTPHGKTLVIEGFDPVLTAPGLTPRGMMELNAIILKNCLNSGHDALIIKTHNGFKLQEINIQYPLHSSLEQLVNRWLSLTINEKIIRVKIKS